MHVHAAFPISMTARFRTGRYVSARSALALLLGLALGACASVGKAPPAQSELKATAKPAEVEHDLLLKLLSAQFALQGNDLKAGAEGFSDAAALSTDPEVAEEATRLALTIKNWPLAQKSLARWQQLAPKDTGVLQARAWIALGQGNADAAFADLDALAARGDDQAWRLIAQTLLGADDKVAAARLLDRLATPQRLADKESNWVAVSQLAYKLGDKAAAQRIVDGAITRFHGGDSYAWSARLALDRGEKTGARSLYAEALKRDPKSVRLRAGYAALLADSGDNADRKSVV